jgi:hypothetical protein
MGMSVEEKNSRTERGKWFCRYGLNKHDSQFSQYYSVVNMIIWMSK